MNKDYFGEIYNGFKKIVEFRDKKMDKLKILNSNEYLDILTNCINYNKMSIFNDIENFVDYEE